MVQSRRVFYRHRWYFALAGGHQPHCQNQLTGTLLCFLGTASCPLHYSLLYSMSVFFVSVYVSILHKATTLIRKVFAMVALVFCGCAAAPPPSAILQQLHIIIFLYMRTQSDIIFVTFSYLVWTYHFWMTFWNHTKCSLRLMSESIFVWHTWKRTPWISGVKIKKATDIYFISVIFNTRTDPLHQVSLMPLYDYLYIFKIDISSVPYLTGLWNRCMMFTMSDHQWINEWEKLGLIVAFF